MKKIVNYKTVCFNATSTQSFDDRVVELMNIGWKLSGPLVASSHYIYQTMIFEKDYPDEPVVRMDV